MSETSFIIHRDTYRYLRSSKNAPYSNLTLDEEKIDKLLLDRTAELLYDYDTIILDATFRLFSKRQGVYEFAQKCHCEVIVIRCVCSYETSLQRLEQQIGRGEKIFDRRFEKF
jgi:predicted kinase